MPVWTRRLVFILLAILLVLGAVAVWLAFSFDANRYKGVAIDWMKANRNRTLVIAGPVQLSVFPRLEVRLTQVGLSEAGRAVRFAGLDEAALAVEVLPLLRGALVVDRIEAHGVDLSLLRDAKGQRNIDDLMQPGPADAKNGQAVRFDVHRIDLSDVRVRVKDEAAGIDGELLLKELKTGRIASGVESSVKLVAQFGFRSPALKGELSGSADITPELETKSARLADMNLSYKGDAPGASGIDAVLKGSLAWDGTKGALDAKALALRVTANAAGVKLADSTLAIDRFTFDPGRKALGLAKLQVRLKGTRAGTPLGMELDWPELDVSGDALKGSALAGKFSLGGDAPLTAAFKSGAPSGSFDNVRVPAFQATLTNGGSQRKIEGNLRSDLVLQPAKGSVAFDALQLQAQVQEPDLKPVTIDVRGKGAASAQSATWTLAGQVNNNRFSTDGSANLAGTTPNVKAQAQFDTLDLNTVLPPAKEGVGASSAGDAPIDLSPLRSVNATLALRAGSFSYRQYRITDARLDAVLDAGMLRATNLQGKVWGGSVEGNVFADSRASRVAVKATGSGVNVNALLKDVVAKDLLEGTGRVTLDIETAGRSVAEMKSRLRGNASLQLRDGAVKGVNLAKSLRQAKAALSAKQDATQKASQTEKTDFSELSASFQIDGGVARSKDLDLKSPYLRLGGDGALDIAKGRIDYTARATVTDTSKGQDGAELAALKGLTVPVRLTGPFDAIGWQIQWSAVAAGTVRNQLEGKLKERLGLKAPAAAASAAAPQDKLKDKLKGLFK